MGKFTRAVCLSLAAISIAGCVRGNFQPKDYTTESGAPNVKKLTSVLEHNRSQPLFHYSWLLFIRMSVEEFSKRKVQPISRSEVAPASDGEAKICYTFGESTMYGPIYAVTNHFVRYYDANGSLSSIYASNSVLWHMFGSEQWWIRRENRWEEKRSRSYLFGLFSSESPAETVTPPAEAQ